ncbi:MAG: uracil phosphoribosyltransferase [Gammaproteobacteria bacterium]|nr:uracil phosphoribosyltransferase [Gammaproteobacteria bacterium]
MLHVIDHPLVQHKLYLMRDKLTGTKQFRELAYEISRMLGYEAMRKLKIKPTIVETPLTKATVPALTGRKLALVPILRAGLSMAEAISDLVPVAKIGHIGIYRDPVTYEAVQYFCKLPTDIGNRDVFVLDPMLATAASAIAAIDILKKQGAKQITFVCILTVPEGVERLQAAHQDVDIYTACVDEKLNEHNYILPGLGDAGDRIFGTI